MVSLCEGVHLQSLPPAQWRVVSRLRTHHEGKGWFYWIKKLKVAFTQPVLPLESCSSSLIGFIQLHQTYLTRERQRGREQGMGFYNWCETLNATCKWDLCFQKTGTNFPSPDVIRNTAFITSNFGGVEKEIQFWEGNGFRSY